MKGRVLLFSLISLLILQSFNGFAQVTSSGITGSVSSAAGLDMAGATIKAIHVPSGTVYSTVAQKGGSFQMTGLRPGGPYKVEIGFVGQKPIVYENIFLELGDAYNLTVVLETDKTELTEVVVTGSKRRGSVEKNGASTVVDNRLLNSLPTISRSITDFTRLTPQAVGNSFGGRDGRYNNITVDGANLNNN
ncbi:MAG: carboxypeptidase-like regulatory domain-containing protein, partial [Chitinophagaceae bacterium]|nr:carboxypeptidase-like regulatory domain-containing protein [Chitinophagaceae bacterium]